jgi:hypothetical protein
VAQNAAKMTVRVTVVELLFKGVGERRAAGLALRDSQHGRHLIWREAVPDAAVNDAFANLLLILLYGCK